MRTVFRAPFKSQQVAAAPRSCGASADEDDHALRTALGDPDPNSPGYELVATHVGNERCRSQGPTAEDPQASRAAARAQPLTTTLNSASSLSFAYVECDVPPEQTLVEWRRERDAARRAERTARRPLPLTRRLLGRWAT